MSVTTGTHDKWTYDDLRAQPDDGRRHEIIDGEHFVMASPCRLHQAVLGRLYLAMGNVLAARPEMGQVYLGPFDVVFSMFDVVEPDLLFVTADQADIVTDTHVRGAPALIVEILSKSTRRHDERTKRRLYQRAGVLEYWLVDTERRLVVMHRRPKRDTLWRVDSLGAGDAQTLTTPLLPGLAVSIDGLFG